ncbi:MAG: LptF/LptG family permease, partial [Acidobacteriota bacterium]
MRRLDRYILAEILGPLALGFLVYTFILLIQVLFKSADLLIGSGVPFETIGRLLMHSLPHIVVMTIPMSLLFGILIGIGRLSTDSELVAIRAGGISLFSLYRPILILSAALTLLNVYLMISVLPYGNQAVVKLQTEISLQSLTEEIKPRVPHTGWEDKVLYIFESPADQQEWRGVFLADAIPLGDSTVVIGERGDAQADKDAGQVVLGLETAAVHVVDLNSPETYNIDRRDLARYVLRSQEQRRATSISKSIREMSLPDLRDKARDPTQAENVRNLASVEIHKRFGFPAACLVFGLLGLPLGFSNARGGRSSGFALSIVVVLIYYIIFNTGEEAARDGTVQPWLAVWLPNVLMLGVGLFLLARKNRDKSLLLLNLDRWIQNNLWGRIREARIRSERRQKEKREKLRQRLAQANGRRPQLVLRLPHFSWRFPNMVDRYLLRTFCQVFIIAVISGLTVYLVADMTENVEDILKNEVPTSIVLS